MFTGIVTDIGRIDAVEKGRDAKRFAVVSSYAPDTIAIGASISHAGCCLTVIEREAHERGGRHVVEVSRESLERTTLGAWGEGTSVNLERALRAGDELGGHLVTGHVDGVGRVAAREPSEGSIRLSVDAPAELGRFIAEKGSIAIDGVSLTVNAVEGTRFTVNIIPHTAEATTLGALAPDAAVNLEVDLVARYLARLADARGETGA